jgi:hypothetical protein
VQDLTEARVVQSRIMESLSELKPPNCHAAVPHEVLFAVKKSKLCRTVLCDLGIYQNPFRLSI